MTTIAYRSGIMAADSGSWAGEASHGWANKLARGPDGILYGVAGNAPECMGFLEWVRGGYVGVQPRPRPQEKDESSFIILAVAPAGQIRVISAHGEERYDAPYYAIGAGAQVAFGALFCGASAEDAIEAAKEHGTGAFGPVRSIAHAHDITKVVSLKVT